MRTSPPAPPCSRPAARRLPDGWVPKEKDDHYLRGSRKKWPDFEVDLNWALLPRAPTRLAAWISPGARGPALQDVQHPHGPARRRAQGEAQNQGVPKKAVTSVRHLEYREVLEEGSKRRAAFAQLRSRAHEIAVLSPFNDKVYGLDAYNLAPAGTLAQPGAAADAGRLRSARLCALRPRDRVPRGARSNTAAAAERRRQRNRKKKIPSSRFLAFSLSRS